MFIETTEHPISDRKLRGPAIKDACSNRNVGLSMEPRMTSHLACNALRDPREAPTCTPTEAASFLAVPFATTLRGVGLHASVGRVDSAAGDPVMKSSFALLQ